MSETRPFIPSSWAELLQRTAQYPACLFDERDLRPPTRRERWRAWWCDRRQALALRIAPWLEERDDW